MYVLIESFSKHLIALSNRRMLHIHTDTDSQTHRHRHTDTDTQTHRQTHVKCDHLITNDKYHFSFDYKHIIIIVHKYTN